MYKAPAFSMMAVADDTVIICVSHCGPAQPSEPEPLPNPIYV